jgi:hypothetical protein
LVSLGLDLLHLAPLGWNFFELVCTCLHLDNHDQIDHIVHLETNSNLDYIDCFDCPHEARR